MAARAMAERGLSQTAARPNWPKPLRVGTIRGPFWLWVHRATLATLLMLAGGRPLPAADFEESTHQGIVFVHIPAGSFTMGTTDPVQQQLKARNLWTRFGECERPAHKVTLSKSFLISKCEITQRQWSAVLGARKQPSAFKGDDRPVESVSWEDVQVFLAALNQQEGGAKYRLPTEAEWEYCCRAGSEQAYGMASDGAPVTVETLGEYAWFNVNADHKTHPVGTKKPNAWGLHDMHGNVWEWCKDWYAPNYYAAAPATNPVNLTPSTERVFRGGSWFLAPEHLRAAFRSGNLPDFKSPYVGFRVVRNP